MRHLFFLSFISLLFFFCTQKKTVYKVIDGLAQGGTFHIKYQVNGDSIDPYEVYKILGEIDTSLSLYIKTSIISRINNNDTTVRTDKYFNEVFKTSQQISELTEGLFDITVGPLVRAWGFMPEGHLKLDSSKVDSLRQLVGMNKISLVNNHLIKNDPRICIDFNAIAQGYTVDQISDFLESKGIINYTVEVGGEVRTNGINDEGKPWEIGIDKPKASEENRELQTILVVSGKSLATSGSYRKFVEENGIKYSHTINPKTGYPSHHNLLSVTVVADNCTYADAVATAIMVMGLERGKIFVEKNQNIEAYFIYIDKKDALITWCSPGLKQLIQPVN